MLLSEIKGDEALDSMADLMDPVVEIMADEEFVKLYQTGAKIKAVAYILRNHKKECKTIMAILDGQDPETFEPNLFTLPKKLIEILADDEVMELFQSQEQLKEGESSGPASENTGEIVNE